jgi:tetratricopeptide (TPR) repeat protein
MIRGDLSVEPEQLKRFRLEAEAIARLRHPNVVQIYEVGEVGGLPYFMLEMLEGGTLAARLAGAPMPAREAAELAATLARAVDAVHRVGFIHRDLKPANVLFDSDGTPKISDFGLARRLDVTDAYTVSGQVMGTPSYMAPEQAQGLSHEIGPPADIYALGAVLYEILTGRPPFKGPTMVETLRQVVFEDPVRPSQLQTRVPRDLETICLKCLAKEAAKRYATAGALADDLRRFLDGETIHARPTPAWERTAKWARRRPLTAAMLALGLLTTAALAVASDRYRSFRAEHVARLQVMAVNMFEQGLQERASGKLGEARTTFGRLKDRLAAEPALVDLARRTDEALHDVENRLRAEEERMAALKRLDRFVALRDRALQLDGTAALLPFLVDAEGKYGAAPAAPDGPAWDAREGGERRRKQIRDTAAAALAVFPFGSDAAGSAAASLPAGFSPKQTVDIEDDRYLLLIVLSEATALPLRGEDPRQQAAAALGLLDRAAALRAPTRALLLRRAACFGRLGDDAAAGRASQEAARLEPADAFDHLLLGREASTREDYDEARKQLRQSLRLDPDSFWAHYLLAIAELNSDPPRAAEAMTDLSACVLQQPRYSWLRLLRGITYSQLGVALTDLARARPSDLGLTAEAEERFNDAEADFRTALDEGLEANLQYVLLMNRGAMRFQRQRWDAAAADFAAAIALEPGRYHGYASLAWVHRKLGRHDDAVEQLNKATALEPGLAALYRHRAKARLESADLAPEDAEQALRDFEESSRLAPTGSRASAADHAGRGQLLLSLRRPEDALAAAATALAIAPDLVSAHRVRVAALLETRRYDEVIDSCDAVLAKGERSADLYRLRGLARAGRNDFAGAIDDYTHALALHPDDAAEIHRLRGWAHLYASSFELALRDFDAVLEHAADDADGHAGRAATRVRMGQLRAALADAEESLRHTPPPRRLLYVAAQTYAHASARAAAEVARRGRPASSDSLAFEARAASLLRQALDRTPAEDRSEFWREVVVRDNLMRPLLRNPRVLQALKSKDVSYP